MLRSPRRLPQRFNRPVNPQTRRLVERRHKRHKQFTFQKWQRVFSRLQRRAGSMKKIALQFAVLSVTGLLLLGIGLALFSPILHIQQIRVMRSDPRIDAEEIQQVLAPMFGEHLFLLSTQEVKALIEESVADLATSEIVKEYPSTLQVRLTLDPVIARLIIETPGGQQPSEGSGDIVTGSGDVLAGSGAQTEPVPQGEHYLTDEGVYMMYQPSQVQPGTGGLLELTVVDWGIRPEPRTQLIEPEFLDTIRAAEESLRSEFGIASQNRTLFVRAREFHLKTPTYALWFDLRSTLDEQMTRYRLFLQSAGPEAATEYVDLRLKDKIVYR